MISGDKRKPFTSSGTGSVKGLVKSGMTVLAVLHDPNIAFRYGQESYSPEPEYPETGKGRVSPDIRPFLAVVYGITHQGNKRGGKLLCDRDGGGRDG